LFALFAAGAVVMRGAGCTLNDIVDRRIDAEVVRTRDRPLPSGRITLAGAVLFLGAELLAGLAILLQLNRLTIGLGCASLLLVALYPFMKRITWWPQLVLGLAFNWGAVMGWTAARGAIGLPCLLLYAGGIFWTLGYDTIYAHQDKADDSRIGVKSTARRFGGSAKPPVALFYALALALIGIAGWMRELGTGFYILLAATALFCTWLIAAWQPDDPADCLKRFKANAWIGLALFGAIALGCSVYRG
jgi:4-hydroxybenzoate polyprenyltransferase